MADATLFVVDGASDVAEDCAELLRGAFEVLPLLVDVVLTLPAVCSAITAPVVRDLKVSDDATAESASAEVVAEGLRESLVLAGNVG